MNIRHTATLALVGWYLMAPPFTGRTWEIETNAPLKSWNTIKSYDNARSCDFDREGYIRWAVSFVSGGRRTPPWGPLPKDMPCRPLLDEWTYAQCVSTDDPRLTK
ncbi:MAG TPA: hypothetical protein VMV15_07520 [Candidatus Binataceae bacterium]|nr:hypothetical protein [Candidatus Binataceae bacterium]